jgi:3-oxoacyl-[acyl-carrier protein] reductase
MDTLKGKVALVTGGSRGLGVATAEALGEKGADVAISYVASAEKAEDVVRKLKAKGVRALAIRSDQAEPTSAKSLVDAAVSHLGKIDILVNNAGIAALTALDDARYDDIWTRVLAINLTAHQRIVRAALPHLRRSKAPRVVNIASTEALGATARDSAYAAAKAGVAGLTRALAVDLGPEGITVNCICPGPISTAMTKVIPDDHKVIFAKRRTALRRYGEPEEVAHMTLSLCLPAASYITGAVIPVDGGLMARNA